MSHDEKGNPAVVTQPGVGFAQPGYGGPAPQGYQYNAQGQGQAVQGNYPPNGGPGVGYVGPAAGVPGGPPAGVVFMDRPQTIPGVPPGLEYLSQIDQLLVHQQVEVFELLTSWETANRYRIKNSVGQQVYFANEESGTCMRQCCGPQRGFIMHITDNLGQEVIRVVREFKCCAGWSCCANCNCCAMVITIEAPVGQVIGSVRQTFVVN